MDFHYSFGGVGKLINRGETILCRESQRSNKSINDLFLPRNYRTHMRHHVSQPKQRTVTQSLILSPFDSLSLPLEFQNSFFSISNHGVASPTHFFFFFTPPAPKKSLNVYWIIADETAKRKEKSSNVNEIDHPSSLNRFWNRKKQFSAVFVKNLCCAGISVEQIKKRDRKIYHIKWSSKNIWKLFSSRGSNPPSF